MVMAKNLPASIWRTFAKRKDFTPHLDSPNLLSLWMSFGKCKLCLRVKNWAFSGQISFYLNAISSFQKSCKILGQVSNTFASECILNFVSFAFQKIHAFCFEFSFQLHLHFLFHFTFAENLRILVCKVLGQKYNLFSKLIILPWPLV